MATTMSGAFGASAPGERVARPSFFGVLRGEWIKVTRMWAFWVMIGLMLIGYVLFAIILTAGGNLDQRLAAAPLQGLYIFMTSDLFLLRVFWGMMMIILTARLVGMEYSSGTIRVLLARGVGRLQLLFAKLTVVSLIAVIGGALLLVWATLCGLVGVQLATHSLDALKSADAMFWSDTRLNVASVLVSLGSSILLAAAVTTVTRSLAAGLSVSIAWFPVDNFSILLLVLGDRLTHWDFWSLVSGDFLGLNLNAMSTLLMSPAGSTIRSFLVPLTPVTGAHTLLVAGIYSAVALVVMITMAALPDVKE
ncbi:MAG TPA: ABC transporter permease [Ktedonobacterales bacterium]